VVVLAVKTEFALFARSKLRNSQSGALESQGSDKVGALWPEAYVG